jgi:hypothetical protein
MALTREADDDDADAAYDEMALIMSTAASTLDGIRLKEHLPRYCVRRRLADAVLAHGRPATCAAG